MAAGDTEAKDRATATSSATVMTHQPQTVRAAPTVDGAQTVRFASPQATSEALLPIAGAPSAERRFEDQGQIARGGMAAIRKVFDTVILRNAAMKVMTGAVEEPGALSRFVEEAQITGQLDHPNIVPVYDIGVDERGLPTRFTMKLVHGDTLATLLDENAKDPDNHERLERALRVFLKVCDAVSFAHSRGVVHRDLKPANVMVGSHGQVYVMDWGIALVLDGEHPRSPVRLRTSPGMQETPGTLSGTPAYMAPEQAVGDIEAIDARTDVFGLGAILYEMITFQPPYAAQSREQEMALARAGLVTPPQQLTAARPLPPGLCRIAMKALSPRREDRYPDVEALKQEVEAFLRGGGWFAVGQFPAGALIVREGEPGDVAYIVQSGRCRIEKRVDGRSLVIGHIGPGDVFGEAAIFSASPRTATVIAEEAVTALVVTAEALERELSTNTWLGSFVHALAKRFVDVDRQLSALGRGQR